MRPRDIGYMMEAGLIYQPLPTGCHNVEIRTIYLEEQMEIPIIAQVECSDIWTAHNLRSLSDDGMNILGRTIFSSPHHRPKKTAMAKSAVSLV
jgi:hypothetical protein